MMATSNCSRSLLSKYIHLIHSPLVALREVIESLGTQSNPHDSMMIMVHHPYNHCKSTQRCWIGLHVLPKYCKTFDSPLYNEMLNYLVKRSEYLIWLSCPRWSTNQNLHTSVLCGHWIQSKEPARSDGIQERLAIESQYIKFYQHELMRMMILQVYSNRIWD